MNRLDGKKIYQRLKGLKGTLAFIFDYTKISTIISIYLRLAEFIDDFKYLPSIRQNTTLEKGSLTYLSEHDPCLK